MSHTYVSVKRKNWMEYKSENMMSVHQVKFKDYKIMVHILEDLLLLIKISETVSSPLNIFVQ